MFGSTQRHKYLLVRNIVMDPCYHLQKHDVQARVISLGAMTRHDDLAVRTHGVLACRFTAPDL